MKAKTQDTKVARRGQEKFAGVAILEEFSFAYSIAALFAVSMALDIIMLTTFRGEVVLKVAGVCLTLLLCCRPDLVCSRD